MTWVAVATIAGSYLISESQKDSASKASKAQTASAQAGIQAQQQQQAAVQELLAPYTQAGTSALQQQQALLGVGYASPEQQQAQQEISGIQANIDRLSRRREQIASQASKFGSWGGAIGQAVMAGTEKSLRDIDAAVAEESQRLAAAQQGLSELGLIDAAAQQRAAISGIAESPLFQSQVQQGEQALLQNASATGGLRGGNIQAALAQFRPSMLSQAIQNQYQNLAGLTSLGQQSAAGVGTAGMQTATNVGNLLQQQGAAQAGGYLAQGAAQQQMYNAIPQAIGTYYGLQGQNDF